MKSNDCGGVRRWCRMLAVLSVLAACGGSVLAQTSDADGSLLTATAQDIGDRYPAGSIKSAAQADQALRDMREERKRIGAAFERSSRACLGNFFMTGCLLDAKEQRRVALQRAKVIEVEANTFKRQLRADARDDAIDARRKIQEGAESRRHETDLAVSSVNQ